MKALFTIYGMIFSPQTPLWHFPDSPGDKSATASNKSPCNLNLGSILQVQLLAAELCSRGATDYNIT